MSDSVQHQAALGKGISRQEDSGSISHFALILGTTLALLVGIVLGLVWGAHLGSRVPTPPAAERPQPALSLPVGR